MIKELFASLLLATNIGTPLLPRQTNTAVTLGGSWCLKDTYDSLYFTDLDDETYYFNDLGVTIWMFYDDQYSSQLTDFYIHSDSQYENYLLNFEFTGENYYYYFDDTTVLSDYNEARYLIVYFTSSITIDYAAYRAWTALFTSSGNEYVKYYNGYYTFLNPFPSAPNTNFELFGPIMINNGLFNNIDSITGDVTLTAVYNHNDVGDHLVLVSNYKVEVTQSLYFGGVLIPDYFRSRMLTCGFFEYYRPTQYDDADFNDLLFSVIDSPIYMLSRLLNFELFGMKLYIAFSGLLTVCVIVVLIRKFF